MLRFALGLPYFFRFYFVCFFICQELYWMRHLCISFTSSCFCSSRRGSKQFEAWGQGVKNFRTGGLPIWAGGIFCWRGQYPITCHVFIMSPTPLPPRFCLVFSSIFITELELQLYDIISPSS